MKENDLDIFNLSVDDFKSDEKTSTRTDFYKTDPKKGKDQVYRSVIRFLPNINNPKKSIIKKFQYWLENSNGEGFYVDCPSSINEKSVIQDAFWKLFKSDSAFDKKQAERFKRKDYYYSYILVQRDPQNPDLEGTVQIFRYPKAIKKLIDSQIQPDPQDVELGSNPVNVFDFFGGKDFIIKVSLKGGYWNYDECKFTPSPDAISIKGVKMTNDEASRNKILSLYEGVSDIGSNEFKPWTDDMRNKVNSFLSEVFGNDSVGDSYSKISNKTENNTQQKGFTISPKEAKKENSTDLNLQQDQSSSADSDEDIQKWLDDFGV